MIKFFKCRFDVVKSSVFKSIVFLLVCIVVLATSIVVPINNWKSASVLEKGLTTVRGDSMEPTIKDGDVLYTKPVEFEYGEIVVADCPPTTGYENANGMMLLKRIIGKPGDKIELTAEGVLLNGGLLDESAYTADQDKTLVSTNVAKYNEVLISDNEYYILGDHRVESFDSRHTGALSSSRFIYGLTLEPNEHTMKIRWLGFAMIMADIIYVVLVPMLALLALSIQIEPPKPKEKKKSLAYQPPKASKPIEPVVKPTMNEIVEKQSKKNIVQEDSAAKNYGTKKKSSNKSKTSKNRRKMANKSRSQQRKKK